MLHITPPPPPETRPEEYSPRNSIGFVIEISAILDVALTCCNQMSPDNLLFSIFLAQIKKPLQTHCSTVAVTVRPLSSFFIFYCPRNSSGTRIFRYPSPTSKCIAQGCWSSACCLNWSFKTDSYLLPHSEWKAKYTAFLTLTILTFQTLKIT